MGAIPRLSDQARLNAAYDGVWANMVLLNGFVAVGGFTPQFMKDSRGRVYLRGRVTAPGAQSVIWTPPGGFAPLRLSQFFDWTAGGNDLVNPSTMCSIDGTGFNGGWSSALVVPGAGVVVDLSRCSWSTL